MNGRRNSVLVIEDHDSIRLLLGSMLSKYYRVTTLKDGLEGMAWLVKGNLPDIILLDVSMPRLNGEDFLKNIRQSGFFSDIPVIVVSGNDTEADIYGCSQWGINEYITKPFNPIELKNKITNILATREMAVLN